MFSQSMDYAIVRWLNEFVRSSSVLSGAAVALAVVLPYALVAALGAAIMFRLGIARSRALTATLAGLTARFVLTPFIRFLIVRERPFVAHAEVVKLFNREESPSFPSGHAAFFFAVAWSLWFVDRRWSAVFFVGAILVSLGRVASGAHYPTDILGGAVVGFAAAWFVERLGRWYERRNPSEFSCINT